MGEAFALSRLEEMYEYLTERLEAMEKKMATRTHLERVEDRVNLIAMHTGAADFSPVASVLPKVLSDHDGPAERSFVAPAASNRIQQADTTSDNLAHGAAATEEKPATSAHGAGHAAGVTFSADVAASKSTSNQPRLAAPNRRISKLRNLTSIQAVLGRAMEPKYLEAEQMRRAEEEAKQREEAEHKRWQREQFMAKYTRAEIFGIDAEEAAQPPPCLLMLPSLPACCWPWPWSAWPCRRSSPIGSCPKHSARYTPRPSPLT